ncbi:MAG: hypothetical protein K2W96_22985, partial [Gemmataceae bacterium]|nr:hypothetical protein [Gemmataceae bacterium]
EATFWEVFDAICRQCGAQRASWGGSRNVYLWPAPAKRVASCCSGLFRITATQVLFSRTSSLTEAGGTFRRLKVQVDVAIEPGHPLMVGQDKVAEAKDARGRSLVEDDSNRWRSGEWKSDNEVTLWLEPPKKRAKRIASLKGTIRFKVRVGPGFREVEAPFAFRDLPLP